MDFAAFKLAVMRAADALQIADYELYYQTVDSTSVSAYLHETNQFTSSKDGGVCFRCIVDGKMGYASTEELSEEQAKAIVRHAADNAAALESTDPVFLGEGGQKYEPLEMKTYDLPETDEMIRTVLNAQEAVYAADPAVVDGSTTQCLSESSEIAIYNSRGLDLHYQNHISGLVLDAVVSNGREMANDFQIKLGKLDTIDPAELAQKAVKSAILQLDSDVAPTGAYPVIFNPDAMASLLATYSGVFSSENAQKGLSRLVNQEGQRIASPAVTLIDNPFYVDNPMPIHFDAEGSPTHCKKVIENGVLQTLLYNMKTAAVAGRKTTGNASKAGYNSSVGISPFTMYLAGGELSEDELLEKAGNGVYINSLNGLHAGANPISGDFSLQSSGFMVENGKKTIAVKSFTVAGNFYDLLKNITDVASNLTLPNAFGMTAFGSPSVLATGLTVAGK